MSKSLGPLQNGSTVAVIGGGPGGAGCALALRRLARDLGRNVQVIIYEFKTFTDEESYNQCAGVLSPPADRILEQDLDIPFPRHLIQRPITGYILHSRRRRIFLDGDGIPSYAVRRIEFDNYLLQQARLHGIQIRQARAIGLEFHPDRVTVISEQDRCDADVVVGAFGLDKDAVALMARSLHYRAPRILTSIVAKLFPDAGEMENFGNRIHAFLPSIPLIEFGAITPKSRHLTANIAGVGLTDGMMKAFLDSPAVRSVLPDLDRMRASSTGEGFYTGQFPISLARGYYGDRYVMVGDAAGLVRAFKGKGVNSACLTGRWAAEVMLRYGISKEAFADHYERACAEIIDDLPYGRAVRYLVMTSSRLRLIDRVIVAAEKESALKTGLFNAVSGHLPYRDIVREFASPALLIRIAFLMMTVGKIASGDQHAARL